VLQDLLIQRLNERIEQDNAATDIMSWYNFVTFDIITDLTFGEPLYCLRDRGYHPWVKLLLGVLKSRGVMATRRMYPMVAYWDCSSPCSKTTPRRSDRPRRSARP
jgi:hypothetical protein